MPSIAEELATDVKTIRFRTTRSRKKGLTAESLEPTLRLCQQQRNYTPQAKGTLDGVRVLDLSRLFAGNLLSQILGDWDAFARMVRRSRQFGFMGAGCIHPGQVPIVNREYSPSAEEAAYARRVIEENANAEAAGRASFAIDGKMIDVPVVVRAQRLLARLAAIEAREARKRAAEG